MKHHYFTLLYVLLLMAVLVSCQREAAPVSEQNLNTEEQLQEPDRIIGLGTKLQNPYTVANMQQAWQNLTQDEKSTFAQKTAGKTVDIAATDYYVRFLPADDEEKETLEKEDDLTLFDMPLDYELEEGVAGAYHDPGLPPGQITWQYTVVPVGYRFREGISYELLAGLFLQDEQDEASGQAAKQQLSPELWAALEDEALKITGHKDEITENATLAAKPKWYPSGTILYEDTTTGDIVPLSGVRVVVKRWFKWKHDI
ncbi:MAG: hypothetical protein AAF934_02635, partial [Bacteroidota bacterium]